MMKKIIGLIVLALLLVGVTAVFANHGEYLVSDQGIAPALYDGNVECNTIGQYEYVSPRFDEGDQWAGTWMDIDWWTVDGKFVSWDGTHNGLAIIVKGGSDAHVYSYTDATITNDGNLVSPPTGQNHNIPDLSNITFCWNPPDEVEEGQWCSPGYWRQEHHLDSWAATGISPDELYADYFGAITLSKKALNEGANANPTLWEVLQAPQLYGGEAFNNVGDLLSNAHPDVNFLGERIEDSCPLN
jgi:hypothetical protein